MARRRHQPCHHSLLRIVTPKDLRDLRPRLVLDLPDAARILEAGRITAKHAMPAADAVAAATALAHHATLLTGDPELPLSGTAWAHEDLRGDEGRSPRPTEAAGA